MKRIFAVAFIGLMPVVITNPAYADHDERSRCDSRNGGCSEREESYEHTGCKYVCPSFERSPVHDAFNFSPTICLPGSTCNFDGSKEGNGDGGSSGNPQ